MIFLSNLCICIGKLLYGQLMKIRKIVLILLLQSSKDGQKMLIFSLYAISRFVRSILVKCSKWITNENSHLSSLYTFCVRLELAVCFSYKIMNCFIPGSSQNKTNLPFIYDIVTDKCIVITNKCLFGCPRACMAVVQMFEYTNLNPIELL